MPALCIIIVPLLLAAGAFLSRNQRSFGIINAAGYLAVLICAAALLHKTIFSGIQSIAGFIYIDGLSAFFILVISVVAFAAAFYSISYIDRDVKRGTITQRKAKLYYALFNLFCFSMFLVPAVGSLGLLWAAIEMTTLISAFLVGFYNTKNSIEAAWKYIIVCSAGIIFALLGTILFSYAFSLGGLKSLSWPEMARAAASADKNILRAAFVFILVGYGTKAGLVPMHTWLPDAHSQAVSPISALLSGVLLKTAIYAILRFATIMVKNTGMAYFSNLMIFFGLISLVVSCGFILAQKDLKRLLAYSSIEHIGIIAVGLGLATPLAVAGALLHIFNHAVIKSLMFFGAANIIGAYKKHNMNAIRGVIQVMPFTGIMVLLGVFALTGLAPFSIFVSELFIVVAAFMKGAYFTAGVLLLFLAVIFGAFIHHFAKMLFGKAPKDMARQTEPLSVKAVFLFLFILACAVGPAVLFMQKDLLWISRILFQG